MIVAERLYGTFTRQVFLGETLDAENIAAGYAAGVLTLTIPVREAAKPRNTQVTSSDTKQAVSPSCPGQLLIIRTTWPSWKDRNVRPS
jgi:HSP20 family protein